MDTQPHLDNEFEDSESTDRLHRAYGRKVKELLSQSDAETWIEDLWDMYTGFTLFSQEAGYDPRGHNRFVSFKELVFFFQDVGKMKKLTFRSVTLFLTIPLFNISDISN